MTKQPTANPSSHGGLGWFCDVSATPLRMQLPANAPAKATENGPTTSMGDPDGVSGFWLQPGPITVVI